DDKQFVEVTLQALGTRDDGKARDPVKFTFQYADQAQPRYWMVYTGQKNFLPRYQYQVRVVVKGTLFSHGQEWTGAPVQTGGSGPLMVSVPTPDDPGVTKKAVPLSAFSLAASSAITSAPPATPGHPSPPPPTSGPAVPPPPTGRSTAPTPLTDISGWSVT